MFGKTKRYIGLSLLMTLGLASAGCSFHFEIVDDHNGATRSRTSGDIGVFSAEVHTETIEEYEAACLRQLVNYPYRSQICRREAEEERRRRELLQPPQ